MELMEGTAAKQHCQEEGLEAERIRRCFGDDTSLAAADEPLHQTNQVANEISHSLASTG
jgi:hypothetical protein